MFDRIRAALTRLDEYAAKSYGIGYPATGWAPPPGWVGVSSTGQSINGDNANTVAAWKAAVQVISEDVASLPLHLYRINLYRINGKSRDKATDDPLYRLLHAQPNPELTSMAFREILQAHLLTWGNAYAEKELNGSGRVIGLWPLRPDRMEVYRDKAGRRAYRYRITDTERPTDIPAARVFHLAGLGYDGLQGYSVLQQARETLGISLALREYGGRVLQNDARPGIYLKHPGKLSDPARKNLENSWDKEHGGFSNAGRTAVLEEGVDIGTVGFPPEDIQFLEAQKWQVTEVARWFRLSPHKIGDLERATFSNIEESNIDHATSTLRAWLVRWEQGLNKDVVMSPDLFAEHSLDGFLRGKTLERFQAFALAIQNKAMTPNEWRAFENWNPVEWGDEPVETPNNTPPETPAPGPPSPKALKVQRRRPNGQFGSGDGGAGGGGGGGGGGGSAGEAAEQLRGEAVAAEPGVTAELSSVAEANGMRMEGLKFAVKEQDSLTTKIQTDMDRENITAEQAAAGINDHLRYTMVSDEANYSANVSTAMGQLESQGYTLADPGKPTKDFFRSETNPDPFYQGSATILKNKGGQRLELQFHTEQSMAAKHKIHPDYKEYSNSKSPERRAELHARMQRVERPVRTPPGWPPSSLRTREANSSTPSAP